jgi:Winged helix domain, variant/ATPase family associated with various cellular activities (AAA)
MNDLDREFERLDAILAFHIEHFRATREQSADRFGGLYIDDRDADNALKPGEDSHAFIPAPPTESPLADLANRFQLAPFERDVLLLAAAPEFDERYQTLYGYLQNDATRRHPSAGFALRLFSRTRAERWVNRRYFEDNRDLLSNRLIRFVEDPHDHDPSLPARQFRIFPRIAGILSGQKASDPQVAGYARVITPGTAFRDLVLPADLLDRFNRIAMAIRHGGLLHLRGHTPQGQRKIAESVAHQLNKKLVVYDYPDTPLAEHGAILRRECRLLDAMLYAETANHTFARELVHAPFPIVVSADAGPRQIWQSQRSFHLEVELPGVASRLKMWRGSLNGAGQGMETDVTALAGKFCFDAAQIEEAVESARNLAVLRSGDTRGITAADLNDAAREQSSDGLRKLARKVVARHTWEDLILPARTRRQLSEIIDAVRLRHTVNAQWQFESKTGANPGISVMFSGVSGTGKTMAASILAGELKLDLYKIDLARVVSKYIGETEQNLDRIFNEAQNSSQILFFDEADALFGKRSEVKEAHDRYANIEVAYLLQKMEEFSSVAILATNLGRNLDTAFLRRLQHVIEFPFPDANNRELIWKKMFPDGAPRREDIDFTFLARQFEFSGGNIRNAVLAAAYLAAAESCPISMGHLIQATGREYQKMGKLPSRGDFREHFDSIRERV